jgi:hypothetical protein
VNLAFTWDWSSWYGWVVVVVAAYLFWSAAFEKGRSHIRAIKAWLFPPPPEPPPPSKRPAVALGHPGASISLTPIHELAEGEHSKVIKCEPMYVIENKDAARPIRDVTTGVRRHDGREHSFDKFRAPMIGPKEAAPVRNLDTIPLELLDGLHTANPELEFLYWARFEDDDGRRWEAVYDPGTRSTSDRELPRREPLMTEGATLLTEIKEFISNAHPMVASVEEQPGEIQARLAALNREWKALRPKLLAYTNSHPSEDVRRRGDDLGQDIEKLLMADHYLANPIVDVKEKAASAESAFNRHASATGLADQLLTRIRAF